MGAYTGAQVFFNKQLVDVARSYNYDEDNICILEGNLNKLKEEFNDTFKNIISCKHHADKRTPLEYAQDLVASWLIEDSFLLVFNHGGLSAKLDGADNKRRILPNTETSTASDFSIKFSGSTRKLELMNDYTGFWSRQHILHLRDNKYTKMKNEATLLLALSVTTSEFALYDFEESINVKYIPYHKFYGGKPAYELQIPKSILKEASSHSIIEAIKEHFYNRSK